MKKLLVLLLPFTITGCCYSQIINQLPDQIYYANDSCEYYLPDYTEAITVRDNCQVDYFYQFPESGAKISSGTVTEVSIVAGDVTGNERTVKFNVMLVDTIPPVFEIDTVLFNSLSHYQNELRTWHLYNWVTASGDTLESPESFGFWGYYTAKEVMYIEDPKCTPPKSTFVPYTDLPEGHPLLKGVPVIQEAMNRADSLAFPTFASDTYYKRSIFIAENDYELKWIYLYLMKRNNPVGLAHLTLYEVDQNDEPIDTLSSGTFSVYDINSEPDMHWCRFSMTPAMVHAGKKYAIHVGVPGTSNDNRIVWVDNHAPEADRYLRYTYNDGEVWDINPGMCYMFQMWGVPLMYAGQ